MQVRVHAVRRQQLLVRAPLANPLRRQHQNTIGIGIVFGLPGLIGGIAGAFWQIFPFIMIGIGLFMLFGGRYRPNVTGKRKNNEDIHHV